MIFHSPILAMLLVGALSSLTMAWAALYALKVVRHWDIESGSAGQIALEKRTYLVVTAVKFVLVMELASLILFVINADQMSVMFTGAMCALGTLNINPYGIPALLLKMAVFFGAMIWLILNHADEQGRDYPLTRHKYTMLMGLAPLVIIAALVQFFYFYNLKADVITSCCSRLFIPEGEGVQADLSSLSPRMALSLLAGSFALLAVVGHFLYHRPKWLAGPALQWVRRSFAPLSGLFFIIALAAIISVISSYIYEQPHHHCPFCVLKWEYGYIGFALYLPLFFGTAYGLAAGLLASFATPASLADLYPRLITRHIMTATALFALLMLTAALAIYRSHLILLG